ncbi:MAG: hypothetical protein ACK4ZE_00770 [Sphingorhabdus sp.]
MRVTLSLFVLPLLSLAAPVAAQEIVYVSGTGNLTSAADDDAVAPADRDYRDASDASGSQADIDDFAGRLADPAMQDTVAVVVENMAGAMMRMPVGGFAEAIENARPGTVKRQIRRDATIADLAGRDSDYLPEELGDRSREMVGMMGGFARAMATMMPAFENMGRDLEDQIRVAKEEARRARNR